MELQNHIAHCMHFLRGVNCCKIRGLLSLAFLKGVDVSQNSGLLSLAMSKGSREKGCAIHFRHLHLQTGMVLHSTADSSIGDPQFIVSVLERSAGLSGSALNRHPLTHYSLAGVRLQPGQC